MVWNAISESSESKEKDLQEFFDNWPAGRDRAFGMPTWLVGALDQNRQTMQDREGFDTEMGFKFRPDVVTLNEETGEGWVIELKYGAKYGPLVLGQALFEAEWLANEHPDAGANGGNYKRMRAGLVTKYDVWNRAAIRRIRRAHPEAGDLEYVEVAICERDGKLMFWFDAPFSDTWTQRVPPAALMNRFEWCKEWYFEGDTQSWFGFDSAQAEKRPLFLRGEWAQASQLGDQFIAWEGSHLKSKQFSFFGDK